MDELDEELRSARTDIEDAHAILSAIGVGKEHWSLGGRIDELLTLIYEQWSPQKLREVLRERRILSEDLRR